MKIDAIARLTPYGKELRNQGLMALARISALAHAEAPRHRFLMAGLDEDFERLDIVLKMIGAIARRRPVSYDRFMADQDELVLTAYQLAVIGEHCNQLSHGIKARHPGLAWGPTLSLRNAVRAECPAIDPRVVWEGATAELDKIEAMCCTEFARAPEAQRVPR